MPSDQREGKFMRKAYLIGLSVLTFSSSAVFAQGAAPIQKLEYSLAEAINKGDAAAAANLYMEDAYFMPPDADPIRRRDAIKAAWEKAIPAGTDLRLAVVDVPQEPAFQGG
jgi:ketosteroid isomerase-like protein